MDVERTIVSRRIYEVLFILQVAANIVVLCLVVALLIFQASQVAKLNETQLEAVKQQNIAQICNQYNILAGTRRIGRSLGLPVQGIVLPDTTGLDCP